MRTIITALTFSLLCHPGVAGHWQFTKVAQLQESGAGLSHATIASNGDIAFLRWAGAFPFEEISSLNAVVGGVEHEVETDGAGLARALEDGPCFSINSLGQVAYSTRDDGFLDTVRVWQDGNKLNISTLFSGVRPFGLPALNDGGAIACRTKSFQTSEIAFAFVSDTGETTRLLGMSEGYDLRWSQRAFGFNNSGQIAFSSFNSRVFRAALGAGAQACNDNARPGLSPSINDVGLVAWVTIRFDSDPEILPGVYRSDGTRITTIWPGNYTHSYSPPILTDGRVAFLNPDSTGLDDYLGLSDGTTHEFVPLSSASGDLGAEIAWIDIPISGARWMNSQSQFVMLASLTNGSHWLVRGEPKQSCPADLNDDGFVDDTDFPLFVASYNILDCADLAMPAGCPADLNGDGFVDYADFVAFVAAYNELVCP